MTSDEQLQFSKLQQDFKALSDAYYNGNFTARQDFTKYSDFTTMLKVPSYASLPATCQVGELVESGGKLKICSATNTWTTVGVQT